MRLISNLKRAKYIGAAMVLLLAATPVNPIATWIARSNTVSAVGEEVTEVATRKQLKEALDEGKPSIKLTSNITVSSPNNSHFTVESDTLLDLDGHTITFSVDKMFRVRNGATLTINGNGTIERTNDSDYPVLVIGDNGNVILEEGNITSTDFAVQVWGGSLTINGGTIESGTYGVEVTEGTLNMNGGKIKAEEFAVTSFDDSVINLNDGMIESNYCGISGNGSADEGGSIFNISGGTINATEIGIYAPQYDGETTISSGIITAKTGVEVRAGNLNITGGTITSNATTYSVSPSGDGHTTTGAAVAVAQHTTRQPINVNITGGMFIGPVALSQADPQEGDAVDESISVADGTFISNNGNFKSVEIEDKAVAVFNGGTFNDLNIVPEEVGNKKAIFKIGDNYVVKDAPSLKNVPKKTLTKVGAETVIPNIADNEAFQESGIVISTTRRMTFDKTTGTAVPAVANVSKATLGFEVYKLENGEVVRDTSFDKTIQVHAYENNDLGTIYLAEGDTVTVDAGVKLNTEHDEYEVFIEEDEQTVASIDENGAITANGVGEASVKLRVGIKDTDIEAVETIGTVKVYSFEANDVTIPVGTEVDLTDGIISKIGNPDVVDVELDSEDYATLSGETADSTLTANAAGTATLTFKVNGETIGTASVNVYETQELDDVVLSVNGVGADEWQRFVLSGTNLPAYDLTIEDESIAEAGVVRNFIVDYCSTNFITGNREKCINAESAGKTKATVTYQDSFADTDTPTTQDFYVHVSRYTESNNKPWYAFDSSYEYEAAAGDEVEFRLTEGYGQDSITLEDDFGLTVESDEGGNYTVTIPEGTEGGTYELKFTDTVAGVKIAERTVTIKVHEIVTSEDELYIKKGDDATTIEAKEKNGYGSICSTVLFVFENCNIEVLDATGASSDGVTVEHADGDNFDITVNEAGLYTVRFSDGTASKDVTVYGIDFEVNELEYHVKTTDTAQNLINAINRYWVDTNNSVVRNIIGFPTNSIVMTKVTSGSVSAEGEDYFFWPSENANAGRYTVDFSALINDQVVDTKTVTIYLYEMYHPAQTEFYGEMGGIRNVFAVGVGDWINWTVPGMAQISYEVLEGDPTGITVSTSTGLVYVTKPGKYVVKYTDTMNRGEGALVDEYTATFEVYNLDADAPDNEIVDISATESYNYTIDHTNTYGDVKVTINLTRDGETTEVFSKTLNYPGETVDEFEFVPTEEGQYNVRIENLSAAEHNFREVETGSFYVIASDFEFIMVKAGETVEIEENSYWSTTSAYLDDSTSLTVEDGNKVTIDTTDMELGAHSVNMYHRFNRQQRESLKNVSLVVYSVVSDDNTKELNPGEVTVSTIEGLYEDTAKATQDLVRKMRARQIPMEQVLDFVLKMWEGTLTDEDIEALGVVDLFDEFKTAFGTKDNEWLNTLTNLNMVTTEGEEVAIEVRVEDINDTVSNEEKTAIENALASYDVDHIDYYDVSVLLKVNGDEIGKLHKLNGKITVALANVEEPASGYTRQYFVVRDHDGTVTVLTEGVDFYIEDGVIYVISDEFSTYAVAYKDTLVPKTPDTGEKVTASVGATSVNLSVAVVAAMTAIILAGAVIIAKRK